MAGKNRGNDGGGGQSNGFKFLYFEGQLSESAMGAFAQALTTLARGNPAPASARLPARATPALGSGNVSEAPIDEVGDAEEVEVEASITPPGTERRPRERKPVKREVLKGVDLSAGEVPFEDFFKGKGNPGETSKRFLVVAAWFNLYGNDTAITVNHIYTAYRDVGLNLDVKDVGQVFRDLKSKGWGAYEDRKFEINDIGLKVVKKMTAEGAAEPA